MHCGIWLVFPSSPLSQAVRPAPALVTCEAVHTCVRTLLVAGDTVV
jgi:hypothetical protein